MKKSGYQTQNVQNALPVRVCLAISLDVSITVVCVAIYFVTIVRPSVVSSVSAHAINASNDARIDFIKVTLLMRKALKFIGPVRKHMLGFVFFDSRRFIECFVRLMLCSYVDRRWFQRTLLSLTLLLLQESHSTHTHD
mgnify:CR=1 FL=1